MHCHPISASLFLATYALSSAPPAFFFTPNPQIPQGAISAETAHANVLETHSKRHIIESSDLHQYLTIHQNDQDHLIYLNDTKRFIPLRSVSPTGSCYGYQSHYAKQSGSWSTNWRPASSCLYGYNSDAGGSQSLGWSFSIAVEESIGLDWTIITNVLSLSLQLSVTETWANTGTKTCELPAWSVVQVWVQPYIAWGWFWSQNCQSCSDSSESGCQAEYVNGGAVAPVADPNNLLTNFGCSDGQANVQCA